MHWSMVQIHYDAPVGFMDIEICPVGRYPIPNT